MRESIGATWIFGIVITFIIIFTGYLAFSVNYAKAFTMKDEIIDILEKRNGPGERVSLNNLENAVSKEISKKMEEVNYYATGSCYNVANYFYGTSLSNRKKSILGGYNSSMYVYYNYQQSFEGNNNGTNLSPPDKGKYNYCIFREKGTYSGGDNPSANVSFSTYRVIVFFSINVNILNVFSNYYVAGETLDIAYPMDGFLKEG